MRVERFQAQDMAQAMAMIRERLGPDAVILHSRTARRGLFRRPYLEVIAAVDDMPAPLAAARGMVVAPASEERPRAEAAASSVGNKALSPSAPLSRAEASASNIGDRSQPSSPPLSPPSPSAPLSRAEASASNVGNRPQPSSTLAPPAPKADTTAQAWAEVEAELAGLRRSMARLTWEMRSGRVAALGPNFQIVHEHLLRQGMTVDLATRVVMEASGELSAAAASDWATVVECVARHLQKQIPTCEPDYASQARTVIFLVGPTGVGKTTTAAKLAERCRRDRPGPVRLVSVDTYRIGGMAQLQSYGNLMAIPVDCAYTVDELAQILRDCQDGEWVFVDTAGASPRDEVRLEELRDLVLSIAPRRVFLTLACATALPEMIETVQRFSHLPLDGLIFTKADETERLGAAISLAQRTGLAAAFVTTGQRIPEDLEVASASRLAEQVLRGVLEQAATSQSSEGGIAHGSRRDRSYDLPDLSAADVAGSAVEFIGGRWL